MRKKYKGLYSLLTVFSAPRQGRRSSALRWGMAVLMLLGLSGIGGVILSLSQGRHRVASSLHKKPLRRVPEAVSLAGCNIHLDGTVRGDFRELNCLIELRRSYSVRVHTMDSLLQTKFRALFERLQFEQDDDLAVEQWQTLYRMSTRLYPVRNRRASDAPIPVYEVNGHHLALPFWIKEGLRREVGPLFHLDTHSDMRPIAEPENVRQAVRNLRRNRKVKEAWHTIAHTVDDCAMPVSGAILSGFYSNVIWGRPSWTMTPDFVGRAFFFGVYKSPFGTDREQASRSAPRHAKPTLSAKSAKVDWPGLGEDIWEGRFRMYSAESTSDDQNWNPLLLDWVKVPKKHRPLSRYYSTIVPFRWTVLPTDRPLRGKKAAGRKILQRLLQAIPPGRFTLDIDLDYFASIDASKNFSRPTGKTPSDDINLFEKRRKLLDQRLQVFRDLLKALRDKQRIPALVTIADSTALNFALDAVAQGQAEYTPVEHTAYLHERVRAILRELYGKQVEPQQVSRERRR